MNPLLAQILVTLGISLLLTLGMVVLGQQHPSHGWALWTFGGLCVGVVGLSLELFFYRRLRRLHRRIRQNLRRKDGPNIHLDAPSGDLIEAIYQSMLEVHTKLRKEFAEMREMDIFRREFLGDVSHELKTPIFAIQGYVETLLDGALEDKRVNRKFLKKALSNVFRLETLVRDLLTISQLESGQLRMEVSEFKIYDLVLDVFETQSDKSQKEGRRVELSLKTGNLENTYARGDKERIRQVLENLVNNAIKYGPEDQVNVEVELKIQGHNGHRRLYISVRDNGPGIAPEHLTRIFERFYRIDKSRSREMGGTGLGLSIVKYLLEAHQQDITVQSVPGQGTTFTFTLEPVLPR
ncbi:MAG: two-component sensor histidine kinase [Bacteroidetes bacterium]|nr:two-component sensor histidine kinase [Bacteroidota bacterium]